MALGKSTLELSGDLADLAKFKKQIEKLPSTVQIVAEQLAEEAIELIREGFDTSRDPYGKPWDKPMLRDGRPMEDTGGLKASWFRKEASVKGFKIAAGKVYAKWLQRGTGEYGPRKQPIVPVKAKALRLPGGMFRKSVKGAKPRKMVPNRGLPERWKKRFREVQEDVMTELFRS